MRSKQERKRKREVKEEKCSFKPNINKSSRELVKQREKRRTADNLMEKGEIYK